MNSASSFGDLVEDQFECVSNMEENILGHSPLDSNKLDHMVTSDSDPTLTGVHSHLTRHIQGSNSKLKPIPDQYGLSSLHIPDRIFCAKFEKWLGKS